MATTEQVPSRRPPAPDRLIAKERYTSQEFLNRERDLAAIVDQLAPLVGVLREHHRGVADQLGSGAPCPADIVGRKEKIG